MGLGTRLTCTCTYVYVDALPFKLVSIFLCSLTKTSPPPHIIHKFCIHMPLSDRVSFLSPCFIQVIPLESSMKRPKNMPLVLDFAALVVVGLNIPFAVYGYLLFGNVTQGTYKMYFVSVALKPNHFY